MHSSRQGRLLIQQFLNGRVDTVQQPRLLSVPWTGRRPDQHRFDKNTPTPTRNRTVRRTVGRSSAKTNTLAASFNPFSGLGKSVSSMLSGATGSVPLDFEDKAPSWEVGRLAVYVGSKLHYIITVRTCRWWYTRSREAVRNRTGEWPVPCPCRSYINSTMKDEATWAQENTEGLVARLRQCTVSPMMSHRSHSQASVCLPSKLRMSRFFATISDHACTRSRAAVPKWCLEQAEVDPCCAYIDLHMIYIRSTYVTPTPRS